MIPMRRLQYHGGKVAVSLAMLVALLSEPSGAPSPSVRPNAEPSACATNAINVSHVSLWSARLGTLTEPALDARALSTLVLVASALHHIDSNAFTSMVSTLASLDLGYNEFTEIPLKALGQLRVLNWLNLQNNLISDLDSDLDWGGLSDSLSSLSLSNNHISTIGGGSLSSLRQLVQLELDGNRLRTIAAAALPSAIALLRLSDNLLHYIPCSALALLPRLTHLNLRNNLLGPDTCYIRHNKIDSLDVSNNNLDNNFNIDIEQLPLKHLVLDLNYFTTIPSFVWTLPHLEKLSVSYNKLSEFLNGTIVGIQNSLERLELDHNELIEIPSSILELRKLRYLSLAYNRLEDVEYLPSNLHSLLLGGNFLSNFPSALQNLSSDTLVYLDLSYNLIYEVSADMFGLWSRSLSTLNLRGNQIAQLASSCFPFLPITELVLSFNNLSDIEQDTFANLTELSVLELSSISFSSSEILRLPLTLKWLNVDNNDFNEYFTLNSQRYPLLEYLNLDFNEISEIPGTATPWTRFPKLKELRLSYNNLSEIESESIAHFTELQSVDLSYNIIRNVNEASFFNLSSLEYLNLVGNVMERIADGAFMNIPKLEVLNIQNNYLSEFSTRCLVNCSKYVLLSVNASSNHIVSLFGGDKVDIHIIDLSYNFLESLSRQFFESAVSIKQIYLSHNQLVQIDNNAFGSLHNLLILNMQYNNISIIRRRVFADMISLQLLDVSHNSISQLAVDQFSNLRRLRQLNLANNRLKGFPRDIFKNTMLEYLDVSNNQLRLFPSSALSQIGFTLRRLELAGNYIEYLDVAMFHSTTFLHELNLAHNSLTVLSDNTFAGLSKLYHLDLSHNAIKANFKELFHYVPRLRRLSLAGISLRNIPHLLLTNLTELNLYGNLISFYTDLEVRHLINLRALDLAFNKFTSLRPAMWAGLPRLISLDVSRNPLIKIPMSSFEGLTHLVNLRLNSLRLLETIEPKAFRSLVSLRSLALESAVGLGRKLPVAEIVSAIEQLELLNLLIHEDALEKQLVGMLAPKLRSLDIHGVVLRRVSAQALSSLGEQRALLLRLRGTSVTSLPARLLAPLIGVPHLSLDLSDNQLVTFSSDILYLNHSEWGHLATKLVPVGDGFLVIAKESERQRLRRLNDTRLQLGNGNGAIAMRRFL
ncbi:unnamed protein product [Leptidea sinapis]|uniref:Chaoptin n=1 Tax=Leptidea sinapis TaxID=189913 RepID=A0A5E4QB27_9NEOP|nr:unnamed protein product [Leptidea sinapis]